MAARRKGQSRGKRKRTTHSPAYKLVLGKPTISPDELHASRVIPVGRNAIYDACNTYLNAPQSGTGIECFRVNKKIVIPTAPLRKKLGLD
jgi:hypothetical protein